MRRLLRVASELLFLAIVALAIGQASARPFAPYERLVKPWLPDFCDVIFALVALLAVRDLFRDDPDDSFLSRAGSRVATWVRAAPRAAETLGIILALALVLAVSFALYNRGIAPLDEGLHAYGASGLLDGRRLYRDVVLVYPPGFFYLVAGLFELFGESLWVMRVVSIAVQVALSAALYVLVRKTTRSPLLAVLAGALMLAFGLPQGHFLTTSAWLAMLASLLSLCSFTATTRGFWIAGALAALTALFKQDNAVFLLVGLGVGAFVASRTNGFSRSGAWLRLGIPCVVVGVATVAFLSAQGVSLSDQWTSLAVRPMEFTLSKRHLIPIPGPLEATIAYLPLLLYAGAVATLVAEQRRGEPNDPTVVASVVYGLLLHNGYWARADLWHLAYVLPPAFVAAPKALEGVGRWLRRAKRPLFSAAFVGCVLPIGFTLYNLEKYPIAQAVVASFRTTWAPLETPRARGIWTDRYQREQIDGAVSWIQGKCAPGEPFFAAPVWPILYFLADRPPASRFILITPEFGTAPADQATILDDLQRTKPKLLLLSVEEFDGRPFREHAPEIYRACFEGRTPEHRFGDFLSFAGMP